jgi:large subunit ribosomal protein L13
MKTIFIKGNDIQQKWFLIDASGKTLGRIAVKVATLLRGKHKPSYTPHMEIGDKVVIINAEKLSVTGRKLTNKLYYRHSGYIGNIKSETLGKVLKRKPQFPLEHAIKGMLPKGRLGRKLFNNVKVYVGSKHPHDAQKPEVFEI